jgi:hypothetical protein
MLVTTPAPTLMTASVDARRAPAVGEQIMLGVDPAEVRLFHPITGAAL